LIFILNSAQDESDLSVILTITSIFLLSHFLIVIGLFKEKSINQSLLNCLTLAILIQSIERDTHFIDEFDASQDFDSCKLLIVISPRSEVSLIIKVQTLAQTAPDGNEIEFIVSIQSIDIEFDDEGIDVHHVFVSFELFDSSGVELSLRIIKDNILNASHLVM
jgi:hypothetical protein